MPRAGPISAAAIPDMASAPVTIAFDAAELCGYHELHTFMDVELRCGFSQGHTSKHYDYRHRTVF